MCPSNGLSFRGEGLCWVRSPSTLLSLTRHYTYRPGHGGSQKGGTRVELQTFLALEALGLWFTSFPFSEEHLAIQNVWHMAQN